MRKLRWHRTGLLKAARGLVGLTLLLLLASISVAQSGGGFWRGGALPAVEEHDVYLPLILRDSP
jgi:hypothetical protein